MACLIFACGTTWGQISWNVQLADFVPLSEMGGGPGVSGSGMWGWTDPLTRREYALMGLSNGTSFLDVTDPFNAVYLGRLPTATGNSAWREIKTYRNHAFIVSDGNGAHGVQVFDLTRLRGVTTPQTFTADHRITSITNAHNIAINEQSGYAYVVGSNLAAGGLVMFNITNPTSPVLEGTFAADGYTHDTQVITYDGPDSTYVGREIAFSCNEDTLTITDVTNKSNATIIRRRGYPGASYVHQGWVTEDRRYILIDDEFDEINTQSPTRTHIFDIQDLDNPIYLGFHSGSTTAIDHNQYIHGRYVYQANYTAGLRILELTNLPGAQLTEVGYYDTYPANNGRSFNGAWSNYPFYSSDTVVVGDINTGAYVLRFDKVRPDLNGDRVIDCADIDSLVAEIVAGTNYHGRDMTGDGFVNLLDRDRWLLEAGAALLGPGARFLLGDANLDGHVDGLDFSIWNANKGTAQAAWCRGDFTANGLIDNADFQAWSANKFQSSLVPESSGSYFAHFFFALVWLLRATRTGEAYPGGRAQPEQGTCLGTSPLSALSIKIRHTSRSTGGT